MGLIGTLLGIFIKDLIAIALGMTFIQIFFGGTYFEVMVYTNELIIDPLRSKTAGFKSFFFGLGILGKSIFIPNFWSFFLKSYESKKNKPKITKNLIKF